jgi:SAM-dependent methyltransferase
MFSQIKKFYEKVLKDHYQSVSIKSIEDFANTSVSYEQRVANELWTFDEKPRDIDTGHESSMGNHFVLEFLVLERRLSACDGKDLWSYAVNFINNRSFTKVLSIGSGTCAVEMEIAHQLESDYVIDCLDLNEKLINWATSTAKQKGLNLNPLVGDLNTLNIEEGYDLIIAMSCLHHFVELEELFKKVNLALKQDAEFITYEPVCRSGMFLFKRQRLLLAILFLLLPKRFRINHQDYPGQKPVNRFYNEYDRSGWTFECIRSGDIPALLKANFKVKHYGRGMTFLRRVSDSLYGPNYDWTKRTDRLLGKSLMIIDRIVRKLHLSPIEGLFFIGSKIK